VAPSSQKTCQAVQILFRIDIQPSSGTDKINREYCVLSSDAIQVLRQEYRAHLERFYACLNLAPPYHSIEKAVQHLSNTLRTKPETFRQILLEDPQKKWPLFEEIFQASGLSRKHRGIIIKLSQTHSLSSSSEESLRFLRVFTDNHLSNHDQ